MGKTKQANEDMTKLWEVKNETCRTCPFLRLNVKQVREWCNPPIGKCPLENEEKEEGKENATI